MIIPTLTMPLLLLLAAALLNLSSCGVVELNDDDEPEPTISIISITESDLVDVSFVSSNDGWVIGDTAFILHTSDGGESWETQNCPVASLPLRKIQFVNSQVGYILGGTSTVLSTKDGGETWNAHEIETDFTHRLYDFSFVSAETGWIVGGVDIPIESGAPTGIILMTTDSGATWNTQFTLNDGCLFTAVEFDDPLHGWGLAGYYEDNFDATELYRTSNGGNQWEGGEEIIWEWEGAIGTGPMWVISVQGNTVWGGGLVTSISTDGGENWIGNPAKTTDIMTINDLKVLKDDTGWMLGAAITGSVLLYTDTGWATWTTIISDQQPYLKAFTGVGSDELWAVGQSGTVLHYYQEP